MNSLGLYEWVKLGGLLFAIIYLAVGVIVYVWKDDRKVLRNKADREDLDNHKRDTYQTFKELRSQSKTDLEVVRGDIRELRATILALIGKKLD